MLGRFSADGEQHQGLIGLIAYLIGPNLQRTPSFWTPRLRTLRISHFFTLVFHFGTGSCIVAFLNLSQSLKKNDNPVQILSSNP
jgi:hypothetical protein